MSAPRLALLPIAVVASSLLLAGCSTSTAPATEPVTGGTLVYASGDAEPDCLDPHVGGNYPQALISTQYLESLVSQNSTGEIIPWLATDWIESPNGLSWEFTLRDDVTFTDGTAFDAEAVKANIAHVKDPETASSTGYLAVGKIESVDALDATHVRFTLSAPDSALLESLTQPWVAMQSPTALQRDQVVNCESPVGTGPFVVTEWIKQQSVTLERNDNYTSAPADAVGNGNARLDTIQWRFIPDAATRFAALQSGDVDVIDNPAPNNISSAQDNPAIAELNSPRPGASNRIELNTGKAPFNDVRVREAFIRAIDVSPGIDSLFFGSAQRSFSVLSSVEPDGISLPNVFAVDPDKATALLNDAGWGTIDADGYRSKDGVRLTLDFPVSTNQSIPAEQSLFEQIQASAKLVGFEVKLHPTDLSSWYSALFSNDYNLVSAPYTKVGPDVLRTLYHSDSIVPAPSGYYANLAQLNDPALDELLTTASQTSDAGERAALYAQAQTIIIESFAVLPLYDQQNHYLYSTTVEGFRTLPPVAAPTFYDAWLND
ncbi:MAG: ABC transporter substrate-binding protein [Rhodoglobus sp.]